MKYNFKKFTRIYRYTFQSQESDDEIKGDGNSVNYKYRMHDPRLGRFFAVDPLAAKYPQWTPYQFGGNQVISSCELEGLEPSQDLNTANSDKTYQGTNKGAANDKTIYNWKINLSTDGSRQWVLTETIYNGPTKQEAAEMASHVYSIFNKNVDPGDKPKNTDYKLIKEYGREEGYKAGLYARVIDGQYFYATVFAGTDDFTDICTDGTIGSGGISSGETTLAIMDAIRIDSWVEGLHNGNNHVFIGHSLGGGLASIASFSTGRRAITFNAMGIPGATEAIYPFDFADDQNSLIDAYIIKGEPLNYWQSAKADGKKHYENAKAGHSFGEKHMIETFLEIYR